MVTYCLVLRLATATNVSPHTQAMKIRETFCQLEAPRVTPEIAEIGHQRRKHATIVLRTDITSGQGLTNQHVNLVSLITLALAGDVDKVLLPKHKHRTHFSLGASWREAPTEGLWDVHSLERLLKDRGLGIQAKPIDGFGEMIIDCNWYHKSLDIADVVHVMKQNIRLYLAEAERSTDYKIVLTIINFDFGLHSSNSQLFRDVMLAVRFSPKVENITSRILQEIQKKGSAFNGLHLRMEDDMADAVQDEGGFKAAKKQYEEAFKNLQYNDSSLLYVASGIFTDRASGTSSALTEQAVDWLQKGVGTTFASEVLSKESILSHAELQGLSSEQMAAVDFLVLKHSAAFVGQSLSTMSYLVQQMRKVSGYPQNSHVLVGSPINEALFNTTLTLVSQV